MAYNLTVAEIAHRLGGAKPGSDGSFYCRCPAHSDKKASLWIKERNGGGLFVKCHAGCAKENVEAVLQAGGNWPVPGSRKRDNGDEKKRIKEGEQIDKIIMPVPTDAPEIDWRALRRDPPNRLHDYRDTEGRLTGYVARWTPLVGDKDIRPMSFARLKNGRFEWVMRGPPGPNGLYNLPEVVARPDAPILIVEGEKAADAAIDLFPDYIAVTWRGGANAVGKADFTPLRSRQVVLLPDADEAGLKAMRDVAAALSRVGVAEVRWITPPPGAPKGWDVADPPPEGVALEELLASAAPIAAEASAEGQSDAAAAPSAQDADRSALVPFVVSASDLPDVQVEYREAIVEPFLVTSSLNMLFAPRGVGKTFLSLALAIALAEGAGFLGYTVNRAWRTLYFDGEMPLADLKQRIGQLAPAPPAAFELIPSERLFRDGVPINLHDDGDQDRIVTLLQQLEGLGRKPDLLVFDNLSSLSGGVNENDNSELDKLLRFLVALRHKGFAVLLIHHAGKGGDQRGASRREDLLDTVISLQRPEESAAPREGAHGVLKFPKVRGRRPVPDELEVWLMEVDGRLEWAFQRPKTKNPAAGMLRAIVEHAPGAQKELAEHLGISEGRVSQILKRLREEGLVEGGALALTEDGRERVLGHFPELYDRLAQQGHIFRDNGIL